MSSINLKINDIVIHFFNGNNSGFARKIGTSEANIRNYREKTIPKFDFIEKLFENFTELNPEWLITGNGPMLKSEQIGSSFREPPPNANKDYREKYYELLEENRELRLKIDKQSQDLDNLRDAHQNQVKETEKCKKELSKFLKEKNNNTLLPV